MSDVCVTVKVVRVEGCLQARKYYDRSGIELLISFASTQSDDYGDVGSGDACQRVDRRTYDCGITD